MHCKPTHVRSVQQRVCGRSHSLDHVSLLPMRIDDGHTERMKTTNGAPRSHCSTAIFTLTFFFHF